MQEAANQRPGRELGGPSRGRRDEDRVIKAVWCTNRDFEHMADYFQTCRAEKEATRSKRAVHLWSSPSGRDKQSKLCVFRWTIVHMCLSANCILEMFFLAADHQFLLPTVASPREWWKGVVMNNPILDERLKCVFGSECNSTDNWCI